MSFGVKSLLANMVEIIISCFLDEELIHTNLSFKMLIGCCFGISSLDKEIGSLYGIENDLTIFKLSYGWNPMSAFLPTIGKASGEWAFTHNALDVGEAMKQSSM